ncbi:hypothetical protein QEN19_003817 [Hanseniaspora menglaensis]
MLSLDSLDKVKDIITNHRQPKKRISKACLKCKNSKNKCINIEKGVCERCVELNEICIYDYNHNQSQEDSKVVISKEYLTLLQNKSMLCELVLKKMFNNFDQLVSRGFISLNEHKSADLTSLSSEEQLWSSLFREHNQFCNPKEVNTNFNHMTTMYKSNLEINPLVQLVLPKELKMATETVNSLDGNNLASVFDETKSAHLINRSHELVENVIEQKKKRRRVSYKPVSSSQSTSPTQSQSLNSFTQNHLPPSNLVAQSRASVLPSLSTIGVCSGAPISTHSSSANSPKNVSVNFNSQHLPFSHSHAVKLAPLRFPVGASNHSKSMNFNNNNNIKSNDSNYNGNEFVPSIVFEKTEKTKLDLRMILNND